MTTVLIVEDDAKIRANLLFQLRDEGFAPMAVDHAEAAVAALASDKPDLMLLDLRLPGMSGMELVRRLAPAGELPPTIVVSGEASISETVEALRLGVHDFIEKPFSKERLLQSIKNTLEHTALRREVAELRSELTGEGAILGSSKPVAELRDKIARAASTDARILIRGESGTGKELVANALHHGSSRAGKAFIKINCAAIPAHLIEDELFGHAKGAFTDARQAKPGLFEEAHGGTLFLDEIGDMDYALQARLLRVLEDGRVRRIGETRDREVDVRVVAATHCALEKSVERGEFREDLYFRLAHLPLEVPALRERSDDVRLLFDHFLDHFARRHRRPRLGAREELYSSLASYGWPGNVRELKNLCERLVVFGSDPLTVEQLPSSFFEKAGPETGLVRLRNRPDLSLKDFKVQCEKEYIENVLRRTRWNISEAARRLQIQRTYLHQKMAALGLQRPQGEGE
jgi:two-component system nitrogen regulation response regulator NtrX